MRELHHQYVMKLEEVHESQNSLYLVLEILEGGELFNYIYEQGKLQPNEYYRIMKCLLEGLAYMDSKGIMHRDLKPENMILKSKGKF
jgi:serine/threonine protein kinase